MSAHWAERFSSLKSKSAVFGRLEAASVLFLAIPWLPFAFGWLRIDLAVISAVMLGRLLFLFLRSLPDEKPAPPPSRGDLIAWGLVLAWVAVSDAGGLLGVDTAPLSRQEMLSNLALRPWPVSATVSGTVQPVVDAFAAFLPAAATGKLLGPVAAHLVQFVFVAWGALLAFSWFRRLSGTTHPLLAVFFILWGALDAVGYSFFTGLIPRGTFDLSHWSGMWAYLSHTAALFTSPQRFLAASIGMGLVVWSAHRSRTAGLAAVALCAAWDPYVAAALLVLWAFSGLGAPAKARDIEPWGLGLSAGIAAIAFAYFLSSPRFSGGRLLIPDFLWEWHRYGLFCVMSFGLYMVLADDESWSVLRNWRRPVLGMLLLTPFLCAGGNALQVSASLAAAPFFLLSAAAARSLFRPEDSVRYRFLAVLCALGAAAPLAFLAVSVGHAQPSYRSLNEVVTEHLSLNAGWGWDRLGNPSSVFFRHMARPLSSRTEREITQQMADRRAIVVIEAENYENQTRVNHVQDHGQAHGGRLLNHEFGSVVGDEVRYTFSTADDIATLKLVLFAATERDTSSVQVEIDGRPVGRVGFPRTRDWWDFSPTYVYLGRLPKGRHELRLVSNGVNVNIDVMYLMREASPTIILEAESHSNATRVNHVQDHASARGGRIIDNDFGRETGDTLEYEFTTVDDAETGLLGVAYATEAQGVILRFYVDGELLGELPCHDTRGWFNFQRQVLRFGAIPAGRHTLRVTANGRNVNLDYFVLSFGR